MFCFQGLHRNLSQIIARAPNSSPAYLSTESRIQCFNAYFADPMKLAQFASKHEEIQTHARLVDIVAKLVGGATCKHVGKALDISHKDLVELLYHGHFKYKRGKEASALLPDSRANQLRLNKNLGK